MKEFDYKNKITFKITQQDLEYLVDIVHPYEFDDLYEDIDEIIIKEKKEENKTIQERKEKHPPEINKELKELDLKTDVLIKKQNAIFRLYSLLLPKLKITTDKTQVETINLNMMLAYELYSILSTNQLKTAKEIAKIKEGLHSSVINYPNDENRKNIEIKKYEDKMIYRKRLMNNIFKDFGCVEIHKIRVEYNTLDVIQHFNYCNDINEQGT